MRAELDLIEARIGARYRMSHVVCDNGTVASTTHPELSTAMIVARCDG